MATITTTNRIIIENIETMYDNDMDIFIHYQGDRHGVHVEQRGKRMWDDDSYVPTTEVSWYGTTASIKDAKKFAKLMNEAVEYCEVNGL